MAKTDLTIQINIAAPELVAAIEMLAEATRSAQGSVLVAAEAVTEPVMSAPEAPQTAEPVAEAPAETPAPAEPQKQEAPAAAEPVAEATPQVAPEPAAVKAVTLDDICNAGAKLVEKGKMADVLALLGKYQVQAVNQIKPEQFGSFAEDLRSLGADL